MGIRRSFVLNLAKHWSTKQIANTFSRSYESRSNSSLPFIYLVQEVTEIRFAVAEHSEQDRNSKTCWKYLTVWFDQE